MDAPEDRDFVVFAFLGLVAFALGFSILLIGSLK